MTQLRFDGKVAIVTGGGGGLGRSYALALAAAGCRVVVNDAVVAVGPDAPLQAAKSVVDEIIGSGGEAVGDDHDVVVAGAEVVRTAVDRFGRLDIVINNAGIASGGPIGPRAVTDWERTIATTLHASVAVTGAAWPHLVAAGGGRVILTASAAMFGAPGSGAYSAAKSSIFGLTRSLAGEGRKDNVAVNGIMPSAITRLTRLLPPGPVTELLESQYPPEAVASFVVWLCHHETPVSGEMFSVGGGRAARVVLAENAGARVSGLDPALWTAQLPALLDTAELGLPEDMLHEVSWQTLHLGKPVPAAFSEGGALAWQR